MLYSKETAVLENLIMRLIYNIILLSFKIEFEGATFNIILNLYNYYTNKKLKTFYYCK